MSFAPVSFKASAALSAYRVVSAPTANTVQYFTATAAPLGITTDNCAAANEAIPVQVNGIAKLEFGDSCAVGALVGINTAGQGIPLVEGTAGTWCIGVLIDAKVEVTGTVARVLIRPQVTYAVP